MNTATLRRTDFADGDSLAAGLAETVAERLRAGIAARGAASLAVSGGRTPGRFFAALAIQDLDWAKVTVTLVDERWVRADDQRSNEGFVRRGLLQDKAAVAGFVGLVSDPETLEETPEAGLAAVASRVAALPRPLDAVVLGMGADGHTASFFPAGDRLKEALDPAGDALVLPMRAAGAGEPRITLTLPVVAGARAAYLHIEGDEKAGVLAEALEAGDAETLPIRAVLRHPDVNLQVFWCP
ncbi:6-phosphogluconolactonase [Pelagibius litoralis]|uniref:6-phosphogluconolactonase n=1 Tax=Pelagibius litoralis TaxID=374515 RepID=A0A967EUM4_9PROT|nr:6-phosphogluconolactonase [Pelagibius litoralis]NIA67401.1 6-phosphogluconolactonase [Pelagibius litoralis]